ncbi:MAG TPA: TIGR03618 family F420-dependent PPOX class oxidoreductase [Thermoleophilaceae bacterium]|jgi:PPOX class probable F420-dependent enzyme|nr:TIGR03618 family F420-dependent PPOX class oxidoreductase [Thermoleophilaceae bacterium]
MAAIEGRARELFEQGANFVALATRDKQGKPRLAVIWADLDDGRIAVNSAEGRLWPENVRREPEVALVVVNRQNPYEYAEVLGRVVEDTHDDADDHIDRLAQKYMGVDEYPGRREGEQRVKFVIEPEKVRVRGS